MREKGISPPPRSESVDEELARAYAPNLRHYIAELDRWFRRLQAAFARMQTYEAVIDPTTVGANTTSAQTFTVAGLSVYDIVTVNKPTHTAGLGIVNARVSAADTLEITFMNTTGVGIDPPSETYSVVSVRR